MNSSEVQSRERRTWLSGWGKIAGLAACDDACHSITEVIIGLNWQYRALYSG